MGWQLPLSKTAPFSVVNSVTSTIVNKGKLNLVSVGPGFAEHITPMAFQAISESDVIVGYDLYLQWIRPWIESKEIVSLPLTQERERAARAIKLARAGRTVALVSSGDIGIYAMAAVAFEQFHEQEEFTVNVIPGVTAANACASLLGSPLSHDFATLSLSPLLCQWSSIENKARRLAEADLCVVLYNVQSKARQEGIYKIINIFLEHKNNSTVCGIVRNAYRPEQTVKITSLGDLLEQSFDMFTSILIGNCHTVRKGNFIVTPRGYEGWHENDPDALTSANRQNDVPNEAVWVFAGTSDGNQLAQAIAETGENVLISTATTYGATMARQACKGLPIIVGGNGVDERKQLLRDHKAKFLVDATHPYAEVISEQLITLSKELKIPYLRYERPCCSIPSNAIVCDSPEEAAKIAARLGRRIFLAVGSKNLERYTRSTSDVKPTWFARVATDPSGLKSALRSGIPADRICAMQGPFSQEFNQSLWTDWRIDCVITKESGTAGGFQAKVGAATNLGIPLVVLRRPAVQYPLTVSTAHEVLMLVKKDGDKI
jgi:precorrin-3B C17-methyltransferase